MFIEEHNPWPIELQILNTADHMKCKYFFPIHVYTKRNT